MTDFSRCSVGSGNYFSISYYPASDTCTDSYERKTCDIIIGRLNVIVLSKRCCICIVCDPDVTDAAQFAELLGNVESAPTQIRTAYDYTFTADGSRNTDTASSDFMRFNAYPSYLPKNGISNIRKDSASTVRCVGGHYPFIYKLRRAAFVILE